jgi:hypothetical protein
VRRRTDVPEPEPEYIVVEAADLSAELEAILARFGVEAVVRVVRRMAEEDAGDGD